MRFDDGHQHDSRSLYINPVVWNQGNQITSDVMDIFTENSRSRARVSFGTPMMVSKLDRSLQQVAGKQMTRGSRQ